MRAPEPWTPGRAQDVAVRIGPFIERAHTRHGDDHGPDLIAVALVHPDTPHAPAYLHGRQPGYTNKGWLRCDTTAILGVWQPAYAMLTHAGAGLPLPNDLAPAHYGVLFQTPEYARVIFDSNAEFRGIPPTTDAAVETRIRRQEALYDPGKTFRFLLCEAALYHRPCPVDVMAEQLDRLYNLVGQKRIELGIIPFSAQLRRTAPHAFWIYDRRLVIVETISEELWRTGGEDIELYERAWDWLAESAEYGPPARRLIGRARASLDLT